MKIAIQGGKASFHDISAHQFFEGEDIQIDETETFRGVFEKLKKGEVEYALLAIENSIAGTILPNYSLLKEYQPHIVGEHKLRIKQNFMALPNQSIEDMKLVKSHYMALLQCKEYTDQFPNLIVEEATDTADSAKEIREKEQKGVAAIAGERAAELYGLEIYAESIETIKLNYTRFFVLSLNQKHYYQKSELNKGTMSFQLTHEVGALAKALQTIVDHKVNLTNIQSVPIIGKPDQYTFYIDCCWVNYMDMLNCYKSLEGLVVNAEVLGEYKSHEIDYDNITS